VGDGGGEARSSDASPKLGASSKIYGGSGSISTGNIVGTGCTRSETSNIPTCPPPESRPRQPPTQFFSHSLSHLLFFSTGFFTSCQSFENCGYYYFSFWDGLRLIESSFSLKTAGRYPLDFQIRSHFIRIAAVPLFIRSCSTIRAHVLLKMTITE
jgi:hypothetical protein